MMDDNNTVTITDSLFSNSSSAFSGGNLVPLNT